MTKCGVDIVEIDRIALASGKQRFLERVFTVGELEYFRKHGERVETLAGMFAAKEAFSKYLGTGIGEVGFSDIEICHENSGEPYIVFRGKRTEAALSISHNKSTAVAMVCGDGLPECSEYMKKMGQLLPDRAKDANKGSCGRIFVVAGSEGMTGAATLSAYAALRCGSGLVTVGTAESERMILACKLTEAMTVGLAAKDGIVCREAVETILLHSSKSDAVVFGPGLGRSGDIGYVLGELLKNFDGTLIIDADGINSLSENIDILKEKRCEVILTPHPGEMSRLTGRSVEKVQADRSCIAAELAVKFGVCVVLKGMNTVIADKDGRVEINPTGNCGMATGGTGDVLAGVIASFAGQGLKSFEAAVLGTYIHGLAGDLAAHDKGVYGLIAGDVADNLPYAIKYITKA